MQPTVVGRAEPHNLSLVHPAQDRTLSIRENARCQVRASVAAERCHFNVARAFHGHGDCGLQLVMELSISYALPAA